MSRHTQSSDHDVSVPCKVVFHEALHNVSLFSDKPRSALGRCRHSTTPKTKKADAAEHLEVFNHVGLLFNEPPGTAELPFI
jgi:hypothetical protein